jgi:phage gpG-like protein
MKTNKFEFDKVFAKLQQVKPKLPEEIANIAKNAFVRNFRDESFFGKKWKEVQRRQQGTKAYKYPKKKKLSRRVKPILVGTGRLKREVGSSIKSTTWGEIRLMVDTQGKSGYNYAAAQNNGTDHIPQREFMGSHPELTKKIQKKIQLEIGKIFK